MHISVAWKDGVSFDCTSAGGHVVTTDGPETLGGQNRGPRPMELLLMGLGACTSFDVLTILQKGRQQVSECRAEITAERAGTEPKVFTRIHVHFVVSGIDLDSKKVERAIELSATKYCSASIMLGKTAEITHDFELLPK